MRYSLTILEDDLGRLRDATFSVPSCEGGAYLLCGLGVQDGETRFLVRSIIPVRDEHYAVREPHRLSIRSASYVSAAKAAMRDKAALVFVHSHPDGYPRFSDQDNSEEPHLMRFFGDRIPDKPHGSLVLIGQDSLLGRAWTGSEWAEISPVRVIGSRFRFQTATAAVDPTPLEFFDRQVRAFGPEVQRLLAQLHIGVVGAGGTGSAVFEQLVRLGVGTISLFEHDSFELSNVNRVYGSGIRDDGRPKADIAYENAERIGLGTRVFRFGSILDEEMALRLCLCDLVFGCTDKQAPRGILNQLALRYLIPVIDMGVVVDSDNGKIRSVDGRVTTLYPGEACLFCRKRISAEAIA